MKEIEGSKVATAKFGTPIGFSLNEPLKSIAMKKLISTLSMVFAVSMLMAFPMGSLLRVELQGHRPNSLIVINGQTYNTTGNTLSLQGLMPGDYNVRVLRPSHWGPNGVVFNGTIRVPNHSHVRAVIGANGMRVNAQPLAHQGPSYWDDQCRTQPGTVVIPNANGNGGFVTTHPGTVCEPVIVGMHPNAFGQLLDVVEQQSFDSDRLRIAKQAVRSNGASAAQVRELMQLLSFESSKLELAKFSYTFVADPGNYFVVNDVFWFSSSVRELDNYISQF